MQEELETKTVSITIQAAKLTARTLKSAVAAVVKKMEEEQNNPTVGRNSLKRLVSRDGGSETIEVTGRIRSFERYARKYQVRYHVEKNRGTDPPTWTIYFKSNQADALTQAFKEYSKKDLARDAKPSLREQLKKFMEMSKSMNKEKVRNKEQGGPEL